MRWRHLELGRRRTDDVGVTLDHFCRTLAQPAVHSDRERV